MFSDEIMQNLIYGLQVTLYGLAGVFTVLLLFFGLIKLMVWLANKFPGKHTEGE